MRTLPTISKVRELFSGDFTVTPNFTLHFHRRTCLGRRWKVKGGSLKDSEAIFDLCGLVCYATSEMTSYDVRDFA